VSCTNKDNDKFQCCTGEDDIDIFNCKSLQLKIIIRLTLHYIII